MISMNAEKQTETGRQSQADNKFGVRHVKFMVESSPNTQFSEHNKKYRDCIFLDCQNYLTN
uniref:Uncharacterized protein n=1 Tax=Romanomermis culicivorax TaxID=13658 RepID=A0A915JG45_ROMCU